MSMEPKFLAFLVLLILLASILGSDRVPWWRIAFFFLIGCLGLWSLPAVTSILSGGPAQDASGQFIRDAEGHHLYRYQSVASIEGFMKATLYLSVACIITAFVLTFIKLCLGDFSLRRAVKPCPSDFSR